VIFGLLPSAREADALISWVTGGQYNLHCHQAFTATSSNTSFRLFWCIGCNNPVTMPEPTELESDIEDPAGICSKSRALHILHGQVQTCREPLGFNLRYCKEAIESSSSGDLPLVFSTTFHRSHRFRALELECSLNYAAIPC